MTDTHEPGQDPECIAIEIDHDRRVNYAMQQNDVPVVKRLRIRNETERSHDDLRVRAWIDGGLSSTFEANVASIAPGAAHDLEPVDLVLDAGALVNQAERELTRLRVEVASGDAVLGECDRPIEVLAYNEWGGLASLPELLAAFVMPNHPAIDGLLSAASRHLEESTGNPSLDGYQSKSPGRVRAIADSIYRAVLDLDITYVNPPASFEEAGQKVRLPEQILDARLGTCLDLALLLAACLEQAGLHPLLVLVREHAFPGVWTSDESFPEACVDEVTRVRKRVDLGEILAFDTTSLTSRPPVGLDVAEREARRRLDEGRDFRCAIDVRTSRRRSVRPLPVRATDDAYRVVPPAETGKTPLSSRVEATEPPPARTHVEPEPEATDPTETPRTRLDRWRRRLLDLSLRNRLIHYRQTKKTIPLLCPDLPALEDALASGRTFSLHPRPDLMSDVDPRDRDVHRERTHEDALDRLLRDDLADRRLHAALGGTELARRLLETYRTARLSLEESGANTLYLALGFLVWYEAESGKGERRAPILLLPLEMERRSMREGFRIRLSDEEPRINVTLLEKLRTEFPIETAGLGELPEDDSGVDVVEVLQRFRRAVRDLDRWDVVEEAHLGIFSFTKFLMWVDLQHRTDDLLQSDVVRHLVERPDKAFEPGEEFPDPARLDEERPPDGIFCPLDADSSQLAAVLAAHDGRSFVLEGPPGTGKSQTITNVIAQSLASNQRVLFVSEKMAALDVVYRRLCKVGLGPFCLELHSNKTRKKDVIDQLGTAFDVAGETSSGEWDREAGKLAELRDELNRFSEAVHRSRDFGKSVFEVTSRLVALREIPGVALPETVTRDLDGSRLEAMAEAVERLATAAGSVGGVAATPLAEHPLRGVRLEEWSTALADGVEAACRAVAETATALEEAAERSAAHVALAGSDEAFAATASRAALDWLEEMARHLVDTPGPEPALLRETGWEEIRGDLEAWIERGRHRDALRERVFSRYREEILGADPGGLAARLRRAMKGTPPFSWIGRFRVRKAAKEFLRDGKLPRNPELLDDLETAVDLAREQALLESGDSPAVRLFGRHWRGGEADWTGLTSLLDWVERFRAALLHCPLEDEEARAALRERCETLATTDRDSVGDGAPVGIDLRGLLDAVATHRESRGALDELLAMDPDVAYGPADAPEHLPRLRAKVDAMSRRRTALRDWCHFVRMRRETEGLGLAPLVTALDDGTHCPEELAQVAERSILEGWLNSVIDADDLLRGFHSAEHERRIQRFRDLDKGLMSLATREMRARLAQRVPPLHGRVSSDSEVGILQHQLRLKRRHLPVRRLFQKIPNLLPRLKPCFLMSPLSVAQYLDTSFPPFDLVVFDEASQIPVWDAVGAIARGKRVVVVGDSKQLPPTSFFQKMDEEEELAEDEFEELESVLDTCVAARLPSLYLGWHYRSRHESLITFSNHHYYGDRLLTFPAPFERSDRRGVTMRRVDDGVYDRGGTRTNEMEARAVVQEIVERLEGAVEAGDTPPTIGVVTFSIPQQVLIEDLLEEERRKHPEIDSYFGDAVDEPVFVKNLENVQGDERDVILFSVCYGPDLAGRISMGFGPLNREGGERRLNVAITRAREQVILFTSLRPESIDLSRTQAVGVRHLKAFLEYAERGPGDLARTFTPDGDGTRATAFEETMRARLHDLGWEIEEQIGSSGYRVDLAVQDPDEPGAFLLGIEGDGSNYHGAATARDRDRIRSSVLRQLGWRLHRVWSTDWWFDEDKEIEKIDEAIRSAMHARKGTSPKEGEPAIEERFAAAPDAGTADPMTGILADSPALPEGAEIYREVPTEDPVGNPDDFYAARSMRVLRDKLLEVVREEAPIHRNLAAKRLATLFGISRVTSRVTARLLEAYERIPAAKRPSLRGEFLWETGQDPDAYDLVRVPAPEEPSPRSAEEIAPEEVANAAAAVLDGQISLPADDLVRETARRLGFQRVGKNVAASMEAGIRILESKGRCRRDGDRFVLPRD